MEENENNKDYNEPTLIDYIKSNNYNEISIKSVLRKYTNLCELSIGAMKIFHLSVCYLNEKFTKLLIEHDENVVNTLDNYGNTAINYMITIHSDELPNEQIMYKLLLEKRTPPYRCNSDGVSPLENAFNKKKKYFFITLLKFCIQYYFNYDYYQCSNGNKIQHLVIQMKDIEYVNILLEHNINFELKNQQLKTPIEIAVQLGELKIIEQLLKHNVQLYFQHDYVRDFIKYLDKHKNVTLLKTCFYHLIKQNPTAFFDIMKNYKYDEFIEYIIELKMMSLIPAFYYADDDDNDDEDVNKTITCLDLITMNTDTLAFYLECHETLRHEFLTSKLIIKHYYPIFYDTIMHSFMRTIHRMNYFRYAFNMFNLYAPIKLPKKIQRLIIGSLNNDEIDMLFKDTQ